MKVKIKLFIILMIIGIILSSILITNTSNASLSITSADLYSKGMFNGLLRLGGMGIDCNFVVYQKDGIEYPAYCLNKDLDGVTEDYRYSVSVDNFVTNVMVWRVIVNGYPYKTYQELGCDNEQQAYLATKQAVYCILYDRDPNSYTATANGQKCLNALKNIVENAKNMGEIKISSDISINVEKSKWEIDNKNNKYISTVYTVATSGTINNYTVDLTGDIPEGGYIADENNNPKITFNYGEKFKILIPVTNTLKDGNFNINITGQVTTKPVLYGKSPYSDKQDYALAASIYEDGTGTQKVYYAKNETKIIILKQETNTQKPISGVEFELLNDKKEVVYNSLVTNEKGEINIENLLPGTYYVRETKTLEGYTLYDKLIEVSLELNETAKIIVNNTAEKVSVETNTTRNNKRGRK